MRHRERLGNGQGSKRLVRDERGAREPKVRGEDRDHHRRQPRHRSVDRRRLVADGARVVITGRGKEALDEAVASLGGPGHALGVAGKADDPDHQADTVRQAVESYGSVDFLVNNTASPIARTPPLQSTAMPARSAERFDALSLDKGVLVGPASVGVGGSDEPALLDGSALCGWQPA
jgi:hypothetical protein